MSSKVGIGSLGEIMFFQVGLCTPLQTMGFVTLCRDMNATYKQKLCSNDLFWSLPSELVCIDFYHFFSATMIGLPSKNFVQALMIHF